MQLIYLAAGALQQVDMPGVQRVKLAKHHADVFLLPGKLQPEEAVQGLQLLRAGAFDLGVKQLAQVALGHAARLRHLL